MQPEDINNEENVLQQGYPSVPQYSVPQGDNINTSEYPQYIPPPNYNLLIVVCNRHNKAHMHTFRLLSHSLEKHSKPLRLTL